MNLATATSSMRAKEIGIKKVTGANRSQLIKQFLGESIFLSFIALIIALILAEFIVPVFNDFTGKAVSLNSLLEWYNLILIVLLGLFVGFYLVFIRHFIYPHLIPFMF